MSEVRQFLGSDGLPKYFFSQEKAEKFIAKKKAEDTHTITHAGGKFTIIPKSEAE
ncbi:hypothetical protein NVP1077O_45 [Vibrio phage 1.077.O._10N.261.45.A10]|nr:hypothetical protein NVP1070O_45 [Vibrio phage 1.070.O._10N.261.45.B2]AUR85623.1 hypothetical protein NVP1077O_45 [Vibrio phage 1.077.O._10N.261.45.A10]